MVKDSDVKIVAQMDDLEGDEGELGEGWDAIPKPA